jgi:predicted metal-binding membrane protein
MTEGREGRQDAFTMGLRHGLYGTGCCGVFMALLFVAGVMHRLWVATP